jgi:hypothetical protein
MRLYAKLLSSCAVASFVAGVGLSMRSSHAQEPTVEEELHVHRLKSGSTSPYDAFAYSNRVAGAPEDGQTPVEYAGNIIFSRLANIEGRIQLKVVKGFDRAEYLGYKSFLRAWPESEGIAVGNCVVCHIPPTFSNSATYVVDESGEAKAAPTLRNLKKTDAELKAILEKKVEMANKARAGGTKIDEAYALIQLTDADVDNLVKFLQSLNEVPEDHFRQLIVEATILDTSDMGFN